MPRDLKPGTRIGPYTVERVTIRGVFYSSPHDWWRTTYCPFRKWLAFVERTSHETGFRGYFFDYSDRCPEHSDRRFRHLPWSVIPDLPLPDSEETLFWIEFDNGERVLAYPEEMRDWSID